MIQKILKNLTIVVASLIGIALLFSIFFTGNNTPKSITLNELTNAINQNRITHITVSGDTVTATFSDSSTGETKKEVEASLSETLRNYGVSQESLAKIPLEIKNPSGFEFWASAILPSLIPMILIAIFFWFTFRQARAGASQAMNFGKSNLKLFTPFKDRITFTDVAGLAEAKQELVEVVDFLKNPKKYIDVGAKIPRGVLLLGQPGTGKTMLARAVAGEANVPFFHLSASEFVEMFVGVGASRTRDAFATVKRAAPAILFIDEIDAIGRERGAGVGGGHDEREQTLNQILVEMDGFDKESQVIVLAATNRPDILDPALLRPGRFDRRVTLDLPDINDREAILKIHARNKTLEDGVDLRKVATRTPGFSGAELANLINEAAILTARKNKKSLSQEDLFESIEKVLLGPERRSRVVTNHEREVVAYHEAGHALVSASLKHADPVHKVSIIARGQAGGYTLKLPIEERFLHTQKQFLADLAVTFGGYVAEELLFNDVSTGASNDLSVASDIARKMVTKYGMSALGPMTFGKTQELIFLGKELSTEKNYSETIATKIDTEVEKIINTTYKKTKEILTERKDALKKIADELLEKETIEQDDFAKLLESFNFSPVEL